MEDKTKLLHDAAEQAVSMAKAKGASAADAFAVSSTSTSAGVRLGKPEAIEQSEDQGLGLRVFTGKSYASVTSADFSKAALDGLIDTAIAMAKAAPEDPYAGLADASLLGEINVDLELTDTGAAPSIADLQAKAEACEAMGRGEKGITNSEGAYAGHAQYQAAFYASSGAQFAYQASQHSLSLSLIAGEGADMQRDYAYHTTRFLADLESPEVIAKDAARRTLERMHPKKIPSGKMAVMFDPRVARQLLSSFASAINGAAVARGTSFLKDKMGAQVFAKNIQVVDDPLIARGLGSQVCDDEGVKVQKRVMVEHGVLQSWFLDTASARQLGLTSTGHASRSLGGSPSPSSSNLYIANGEESVEALLSQFDQAFYVTETFGHGVNLVTGDYSQGAGGFLYAKNARHYPVSEVTIAGNLRDMFLNLQAANDLTLRYATNTPTLLVQGMTVAGA